MKRKRFVRLLMARGIQRNEAAAIARLVAAYGSYSALYESLRYWLAFRSLKIATIRAAAGMVEFGRTLRNAICDAVGGFCVGVDLANGNDKTVFHHPNPRRNDAIDALSYSVQIMSRAEHAAAHRLDGNKAGAVYCDDFGESNGNGGQTY